MDLALALASEPPLRWIIGRVTALTGDTFTMTYRGGSVEGVGTLDHYTPRVGDVVHILASDNNGMVAIGSNNQTSTPAAPPVPKAAKTATATATSTYLAATGTWSTGVVREAPDQVGCWFYPSFVASGAFDVLPLARFTIQIVAQSAAPLEFILHSLTGAAGQPVALSRYRVAAPPLSMGTNVQLPLEWGAMLVGGQALGIGIGGGDFTGDFTGSTGLLTFTPLL